MISAEEFFTEFVRKRQKSLLVESLYNRRYRKHNLDVASIIKSEDPLDYIYCITDLRLISAKNIIHVTGKLLMMLVSKCSKECREGIPISICSRLRGMLDDYANCSISDSEAAVDCVLACINVIKDIYAYQKITNNSGDIGKLISAIGIVWAIHHYLSDHSKGPKRYHSLADALHSAIMNAMFNGINGHKIKSVLKPLAEHEFEMYWDMSYAYPIENTLVDK